MRRRLVPIVMVLLAAATAGAQPAERPARIEIRAGDNRLEIMLLAPVPCQTLTSFAESLEQPLDDRPYAMRLVRTSPPEGSEYILCITSDGTLVVGRRVFARAEPGIPDAFARGDIDRAYPALDGPMPWTWLVRMPVSREVIVTLEIRATEGWPVRHVIIKPDRYS
jgi:hypothetical protein